MSLKQRLLPVTESLELLPSQDRRKLILVTVAQMSTSFLDIIGVALIGLTTAFAVALSTQSAIPNFLQDVIIQLGLETLPITTIVITFASFAAIALTLKSVVSFELNRRVMRFLANRTATSSARLTAELLNRPLLEIQKRSSQQTAYALTVGVNSAILQVLSLAVIVVSESTLLVLMCIGLVIVSPSVALFSMVFFAGVFLFIHKMLSQWAQKLGHTLSQSDVGSTVAVQEALLTYRESFVGGRLEAQVEKIQGLRWTSSNASASIQILGIAPKYALEVALVLGGAVLVASQFLTRGVAEAMGLIVLFLAAASRIIPSLLRLQAALLGIAQARGAAVFACELNQDLRHATHRAVKDTSLPEWDPGWKDHEGFTPSINLSRVHFTYPGTSSQATKSVSLSVLPGRSLALVGNTGSGKSTLADLILGLLTPDEGKVEISGVAPEEAVRLWPGAIAYVPQDVGLIRGTVRSNVALGLPDGEFSDEAIWSALHQARLADFLRNSREGLETILGENGLNLSGGQRQRLGIARALLTRPRLIVLDEATSALDAVTEQEIAKTIEDLHGSVTLVVVAHRLATVRNFDAVCYLQGGEVEAIGTFDEVRSASPAFNKQAQLLGL